jgi:hypothetical protein
MFILMNPLYWGVGLLAVAGLYSNWNVEGVSASDQAQFDIPEIPEPSTNGNSNGFNLKPSQWDDAIFGVVILGIVLFSKPWK